MKRTLRIPTALAFTVLGAAASLASCGDEKPKLDAASCDRYCIYQGSDNGACPPPTCATGSNQDQCPPGCIPAPIA